MKDKARILVVDDEKSNVKLLEAILLAKGYEVVTASGGEECLEKLAREEIDMILLDVMMPGADGFWVTRRIRQDEKIRLVPVVLITALREKEDRIKGIDAGADDFISKPFDKEEVLARVRTSLDLSYYRRELHEKEEFEAVIREMTDGIVVCLPDWMIKEINTSARGCLDIAESRGVNLLDHIFGNFSLTVSRKELSDLDAEHRAFDIFREETEKVRPLYLRVNMDIFKIPSGEPSSILLTLHDVTSQRREEFHKEKFLNTISHKLRTPLTVILETLSLLNEGSCGPLNEDQKSFIETAIVKSSNLKNLIEKLLGFTALFGQGLPLQEDRIKLLDCLPDLVKDIGRDISDKKFKVNIDRIDENAVIKMNKVYFDVMVRDIIENAIKFNDKDTAM
ncbi:MAG: response regulator, partial [Candidatus Omnitrophota bacterium]